MRDFLKGKVFRRTAGVVLIAAALVTVGFVTAADAAARPSVGRDASGNFHFYAKSGQLYVNSTLDDNQCPTGAYCFTVSAPAQGPAGKDGTDGTNGVMDPAIFTGSGGTLDHIGGPIRDNGTKLGTMDLSDADPGTYFITLNGQFVRHTAAAAGDPDIYPVLTAWDEDNDNSTWDSSFNNTVLTCTGGRMSRGTAIEQSVSCSGTLVISAGSNTKLHFVAFGYAEDRSSTGDLDLNGPTMDVFMLTPHIATGG